MPIAVVAALSVAAVRSDFFTVQEVRVVGADAMDPVQLVATSGLLGQSMLDLPKEQASARLLADPQVRSVRISRNWPHAVLLQVEIRRPVAYWSIDGTDYRVDDEGYVLTAGDPPAGAPRIVEQPGGRQLGAGDRVHPDALALALRIAAGPQSVSGQPVAEFVYTTNVGLSLVMKDGLRITLGDLRSFDYKLAALDELLASLSAQGVRPSHVDLRYGERIIYE